MIRLCTAISIIVLFTTAHAQPINTPVFTPGEVLEYTVRYHKQSDSLTDMEARIYWEDTQGDGVFR